MSKQAQLGDVGDVLGGMVFIALAVTLTRSRRTADEIAAVGQAFSANIRAAQGLTPEPTVDEQLAFAIDDYLADPDAEVADLLADVERRVPSRARHRPSPGRRRWEALWPLRED